MYYAEMTRKLYSSDVEHALQRPFVIRRGETESDTTNTDRQVFDTSTYLHALCVDFVAGFLEKEFTAQFLKLCLP